MKAVVIWVIFPKIPWKKSRINNRRLDQYLIKQPLDVKNTKIDYLKTDLSNTWTDLFSLCHISWFVYGSY